MGYEQQWYSGCLERQGPGFTHTHRRAHTRSPKTQSTSHNTETEWHQPLLSSPYAANTKGSLEQKSNQSSLGGFAPQQCSATLVALLVTKK